MTSTRRGFLRALVVAPLAAVVGVHLPVQWKRKLWTRYAAKALLFTSFHGLNDLRGADWIHDGVYATDYKGAPRDLYQEFADHLNKSATGTVPSRGHDGRHT